MTQLFTTSGTVRTVSPSWRVWNLAAVAALTAYSTGVAWQAQFVSYPLYRAVSADEFPAYHLAYNAAIPGVVIIPGFLGFLACAAFPWTRPAGIPRLATVLVAISGLGSILSTVLWAIPRHDLLDRIGQDAGTITSLIQANGVRTALLTLGAATLSWCLVRLTALSVTGSPLQSSSVAASGAPRRVGSPRR